MVVGDKKKVFAFSLHVNCLADGAEVVADMGDARRLDSSKNSHFFISLKFK